MTEDKGTKVNLSEIDSDVVDAIVYFDQIVDDAPQYGDGVKDFEVDQISLRMIEKLLAGAKGYILVKTEAAIVEANGTAVSVDALAAKTAYVEWAKQFRREHDRNPDSMEAHNFTVSWLTSSRS